MPFTKQQYFYADEARRRYEGINTENGRKEADYKERQMISYFSARAHKILADINEKRNGNDPAARDYLDSNSFRERYGAAHAEQTARQRARQNGRGQEMPQEERHL